MTISLQDSGDDDIDDEGSGQKDCSTTGTMAWDSSFSTGTTAFGVGEQLNLDVISQSSPSWGTICIAYTTP